MMYQSKSGTTYICTTRNWKSSGDLEPLGNRGCPEYQFSRAHTTRSKWSTKNSNVTHCIRQKLKAVTFVTSSHHNNFKTLSLTEGLQSSDRITSRAECKKIPCTTHDKSTLSLNNLSKIAMCCTVNLIF